MFELSLMCPEHRVETLSDALDALDALSVSVEDADAQTDAEQALFGEPGMPPPKEGWQRSRVLALYATEVLAKEALDLLSAQDFFADCQMLGLQEVPEQDWVRLTQSQFTPVEITPAVCSEGEGVARAFDLVLDGYFVVEYLVKQLRAVLEASMGKDEKLLILPAMESFSREDSLPYWRKKLLSGGAFVPAWFFTGESEFVFPPRDVFRHCFEHRTSI